MKPAQTCPDLPGLGEPRMMYYSVYYCCTNHTLLITSLHHSSTVRGFLIILITMSSLHTAQAVELKDQGDFQFKSAPLVRVYVEYVKIKLLFVGSGV